MTEIVTANLAASTGERSSTSSYADCVANRIQNDKSRLAVFLIGYPDGLSPASCLRSVDDLSEVVSFAIRGSIHFFRATNRTIFFAGARCATYEWYPKAESGPRQSRWGSGLMGERHTGSVPRRDEFPLSRLV